MTVVRLSDFVSILLYSKRLDNDDLESPILFEHNDILEFLEEYDEFLNPNEVVLMCIRAQRFRLSLQFLKSSKVQFDISFFTRAVESNAYDIAFHLLHIYEDQINSNSAKALIALVQSFQLNQYLKAKLHMTKLMMGIFNFNAAKILLGIIGPQVNDAKLEGNIFAHSSNPLLTMCLLYELL